MLAYVNSDIGQVRKRNEDNYIFVPPRLFGVADGMGGHVAGEVASGQAAQTITEFFAASGGVCQNPQATIEAAIREANQAVYALSCQNAGYQGMGTTVTLVYFAGQEIYWGHVGDSRLYLLRDGKFMQLTQDHSVVWELVQSGMITPEEAKQHPHRNMLTRAVGTSETIEIDTGQTHWQKGDCLLICTDGLTNMVSEDEIAVVLAGGAGKAQLDELIARANHAGGLDNITAILLRPGEV